MHCKICNENPGAPDINYVTVSCMAWHMEFVHGIKPIETNGQRTLRECQEIVTKPDFSFDTGNRVRHIVN